jgi:hypothetical protein
MRETQTSGFAPWPQTFRRMRLPILLTIKAIDNEAHIETNPD